MAGTLQFGAMSAAAGVMDAPAFVTLASGVYQDHAPAGLSVGQMRARYGVRLDLDANSRAVVGGREVGEDFVPGAAQTVVFTKRAGEKG